MRDAEVHVERLAETRFTLEYLTEGVVVLVDRLRDHSDGLRAELSIMDSTGRLLHFGAYNLLAGTWRKGVAQACAQQLQAHWSELLDDLCVRVVRAWRKPPEPVLLSELEAVQEEDVYHLYPLLVRGAPTVLYGDGGTGKSLVSLAAAVQMATGSTILPGMRLVGGPRPVLYLDWEDGASEHRRRLDAILRGAGLSHPVDIFYMRMHAPLQDAEDDVEAVVRERGVHGVVVDSLALAAGQDPWSDAATLGVYRVLRRLGVTSLVVAHVAKADLRDSRPGDGKRPYGTVYVRNAARAAWQVDQGQAQDGAAAVLLRHQKANRGTRLPSIPYLVRFSGGIRFERLSWAQVSEAGLGEVLPQAEYVLGLLQAARRPLSTAELAEQMGVEPNQLRPVLNRLRARGLVVSVSQGRGRSQATQWALMARGREADCSPTPQVQHAPMATPPEEDTEWAF